MQAAVRLSIWWHRYEHSLSDLINGKCRCRLAALMIAWPATEVWLAGSGNVIDQSSMSSLAYLPSRHRRRCLNRVSFSI